MNWTYHTVRLPACPTACLPGPLGVSLCFPPPRIELLFFCSSCSTLRAENMFMEFPSRCDLCSSICSGVLALSRVRATCGQYVSCICMCSGHVFHTFRQVFISKHFTKSSTAQWESSLPHHTQFDSIPCFVSCVIGAIFWIALELIAANGLLLPLSPAQLSLSHSS